MYQFTLWTNRLRKVEGKFGSGVFNYFKSELQKCADSADQSVLIFFGRR